MGTWAPPGYLPELFLVMVRQESDRPKAGDGDDLVSQPIGLILLFPALLLVAVSLPPTPQASRSPYSGGGGALIAHPD